MLKNSTFLQRLYNNSNRLIQKYNGTYITQTHMLISLLSLKQSAYSTSVHSNEYNKCMERFIDDDAKINATLMHAYDYIRLNPNVSDKEEKGYSDCYESALVYADLSGEEIVTAPMLITEILSNLTPDTKDLFSSVIKNDAVEQMLQEEPTFDNETQTPTDILWPIKELQNKLRDKIYGQDEAINALVSGYFNLLLDEDKTSKTTKPRATFLFAGAPGVGKTYLAQVAAKALHLPFRRFDMSSFSDKEAVLEFAGTDKVYKASHEGLVTGFVSKHPKCVLLFDEIEKAHINIIHLFLQILDAGKLKDSYTGQNVLFNNAIIIMTTNAGKSLYENLEPGSPMPNRKTVINALSTEYNSFTGRKNFPEAICSRFAAGNIVLFNPLGMQELLKIGAKAIEETSVRIGDKFKIEVECDKNLCAAILFSEGNRADARSLSGRITNLISQEIFNWFKFAYEKDGSAINEVEKIKIQIPLRDNAKNLFEPCGNQNILLYSENPDAFNNFESTKAYTIIKANTIAHAQDILDEYDISFAVCDIFGDEQPTLNIEDTDSEGRKLMDILVKAQTPTFVYRSEKRIINSEEQHSLLESGAYGFVDQGSSSADVAKILKQINKQIYSEKKLRELGRSKKVLSFDCVYNWPEPYHDGVVELINLRVIPAVDAKDKEDVAGVSVTNVTFDDVIGAEDAKAELKGFMSYLTNPKLYSKNKIPAPKGVMLYGPPGTGKTMLAKAFAHECGAAFIATQGNHFLSPKVGGGASEVKRLFALARKYAPAVLFIDEIDIIAKDRFKSNIAEDVVNAFLNEMDGFSTGSSRPVFVLAATNYDVTFGKQSALDAALLRRFDRRIFVDLPNSKERKIFIKNCLLNAKQDLDQALIENIAVRSIGMSLAELKSMIDFALRTMVQTQKPCLTEEMFNELFETYCFGEQQHQNHTVSRRIAVHESGHAVLSYISGTKPNYITIAGRGNYGGYVQSSSNGGGILTKSQLLESVRVSLAGRAAEIVVYGEKDGVSVGAASDLREATKTAFKMITEYGMVSEYGLMSNPQECDTKLASELCNKILNEEMNNTISIIKDHKDVIDHLVDALMQKNHLMGNEIEQIFTAKQ